MADSEQRRERPTIERKDFAFEIENLERKADGDGSEYGVFEGYASTWEEDQMGDIIRRGAFARTLDHWSRKSNRLPVLWQHRGDEPIGVTVDAAEDDRGLRVKGRLLLGMQRAREAYEAAAAKVLGGLSIGFSIPKDGADWNEDGTREIREVRLFEYSFVTWPANEGALLTNVKSAVDAAILEELRGMRAEMRTMRKALLSDVGGDSLEEARDALAESTLLAEARQLRALLTQGE